MRFIYGLVFCLAGLGGLAETAFCEDRDGQANQVDSVYYGIVRDSQQGTRHGWVPEKITEHSTEADAPARTFPKSGSSEAERRESLRRSYKGRTVEKHRTYNMVGAAVDGCECGENCKCPPNVCKNKHCHMNYAIMVSASWCGPCQSMYPTIEKLRKEGYLIYIYRIDEFKDIDAKFDVGVYPTFIVFDKGKEVARTVGVTNAEWFKMSLKTAAKQREQVKPESPYDGL